MGNKSQILCFWDLSSGITLDASLISDILRTGKEFASETFSGNNKENQNYLRDIFFSILI